MAAFVTALEPGPQVRDRGQFAAWANDAILVRPLRAQRRGSDRGLRATAFFSRMSAKCVKLLQRSDFRYLPTAAIGIDFKFASLHRRESASSPKPTASQAMAGSKFDLTTD